MDMIGSPAPPVGDAMEGQGYYNSHSRPQAAAASQGMRCSRGRRS